MLMRQKQNKPKVYCNFCKREVRKYRTRKNYPFGKKSKPVITITCKRCQDPEKYGDGE